MIPLTLEEVATVVGGRVADGPASTVVTGPAFVDSRHVVAGGLFVAVPGERVDGHDFAGGAVASGAAAVLASRPVGVPAVVVADVVSSLGALARHVLRALPDVSVIAVTGSQGKTGTKDLLCQVLGAVGSTVATEGSFNNELGLPLTVLRAEEATRHLVLEMGARRGGHLRYLCDIAPPDVAVVLNVGKAHLGEFGSQAEIARAKGELVDALGAEGTAVLNADDPLVEAMSARTTGRVVRFGSSPAAEVRIDNLVLDPGGRPRFDLSADTSSGRTSRSVQLQLLGEHQAMNAAAAAAAALTVGCSLDGIVEVLGVALPVSRWRMELSELPAGITLLNDAYNASPDSMAAALKTLAQLGSTRGPGARTIAVLGEMRELGEASLEEHDRIGRLAVRLNIDQLLVVGKAARPLHLGATLEGSWDEESVFVEDIDEGLVWLRGYLRAGDIVLVKASRAAHLESLAQSLAQSPTQAPGGSGTASA